jgi:hypothetical protein
MDLDSDGRPDFDPEKIYYAGQSLGSLYGTVFLAVEPDVKTGVLNAGGGSALDAARWSRNTTFRGGLTLMLALRQPPLLNTPGGGFNENYVLRDQPVKVNDVMGAIAIQELFETLEWLQMPGDPLAFAPHLKTTPLSGVAAKSVMWQYPLGDATVPNPAQSALVRAADMRDSAWLYRHDYALERARLDSNPHTYLTDILNLSAAPIARAVQNQMSGFLMGVTRNPNEGISSLFGRDLFEVPQTLPEELNFFQP